MTCLDDQNFFQNVIIHMQCGAVAPSPEDRGE